MRVKMVCPLKDGSRLREAILPLVRSIVDEKWGEEDVEFVRFHLSMICLEAYPSFLIGMSH